MITIVPHPTTPGVHRLTAEVLLPRTRTEIFEFFSDAGNLEAITPPWLNFAVVTPRPIEMREGALIDYRLRLRGIPIRWRTRISLWDPPFSFVDEQLRGPYRSWRHLHTFEEAEDGCLMRDQVDYIVPGGALMHRLFVRGDLLRIFGYREEVMRQRFTPADRDDPVHA